MDSQPKGDALTTDELKAIVGFALSTGELVASLMNGFSLSELAEVVSVAKLAPGLTKFKLALQEYEQMSDAQAADLEAYVDAHFSINNAAIESVIKTALKALIEMHDLSRLFVPKAAPVASQAVS